MQLTFSESAKLLKKLTDEHSAIIEREKKCSVFNAALGENVESVRPSYSYDDVQSKLDDLENKVRKLKHAMNVFNITQTVPGFEMTIDEMLVYIPQLTAKKQKLAEMKSHLPKERVDGSFYRASNIIDYIYVNYDPDSVMAEYDRVVDELSRAQLALDAVNNSEKIEVDI